jgi:hypothetical protein
VILFSSSVKLSTVVLGKFSNLSRYKSIPVTTYLCASLYINPLKPRRADLSNSLTTTDRVPLIPDAVVLSLITSEDKFVNGYKIQADRHWNDNLYQTIFKDIDEMHDIKIGYICQKQISHTTDKLDRLYKKDKDENLIIDTLLPKKFYSFWNIPESIDFKYIHKMCYFNHLFYIALEREIITWESF